MTGVSRSEGIGFAIAQRLVADGFAVFTQGWEAHDASQPWGAGEVPLREGFAGHLEADLGDPEAPQAVMAAARIALGHVDVLVANHAASVGGTLEELTAASIDTALVVNVRATLLLVKEFAAGFEGDHGRVILLTLGAGARPDAERAALRREQGGAQRHRRSRWPTTWRRAGSPSTRSTPARRTPAGRPRRSSSARRPYPSDRLMTTCPACGKVLFARYDLDTAARPDDAGGAGGAPVGPPAVRGDPAHPGAASLAPSLGEGGTPLHEAPRLARAFGCDRLLIKDEGLNPTGSFKARGLAMAVARARELGATTVAIPSAGNAAAAMAAYAARAGLRAVVAMPSDVPPAMKAECLAYGAHVLLVDGLIDDCGKVIRAGAAAYGWFDVSTLREPYRAEGKKTMGLEIAEQLGWRLPDALIYPTGGGTGIVGMWKAFAELETMGLIGPERPKMIVVQAEGCAPIVRAFDAGATMPSDGRTPQTIAAGMRVPAAIGDYLILDAIRASGGTAITVTDDEMLRGDGPGRGAGRALRLTRIGRGGDRRPHAARERVPARGRSHRDLRHRLRTDARRSGRPSGRRHRPERARPSGRDRCPTTAFRHASRHWRDLGAAQRIATVLAHESGADNGDNAQAPLGPTFS